MRTPLSARSFPVDGTCSATIDSSRRARRSASEEAIRSSTTTNPYRSKSFLNSSTCLGSYWAGFIGSSRSGFFALADRLINESNLVLTIPAASLELAPAHAVISVRSVGRPLPGADILTLFPNNTWKRTVTDEYGEAAVDLYTTQLPMRVFVAAPGHVAHVEREWVPSQRALTVELQDLPSGGSVIFPEATGHIPGLTGRLNPILDSLDRTYLYASNICIDDGRPQPVHFVLREELRLTDADGRKMLIRVVDIAGRSALLEYRPLDV